MQWGDITTQVEKNKKIFLQINLGTSGEIVDAEEKCLQLTILLENPWEVDNLRRNITCGLFTQRLRCWLRNKGFDMSPDTEFGTTLAIVESNNMKIEKSSYFYLIYHIFFMLKLYNIFTKGNWATRPLLTQSHLGKLSPILLEIQLDIKIFTCQWILII